MYYRNLNYTSFERYMLLHMPNILVIQLKSFYFNKMILTTELDSTAVEFNKYLSLPE